MLSFYLCRTFFLVFPSSLLFPHLFKIFKSIRNSTKHLNVFLNRMNEWMRMEAFQYTWMNFQQYRRSRALFVKLTIFAHIHTKKVRDIKTWNKAFVFPVTKRNNPMRNKSFAMALWFVVLVFVLSHTVYLKCALFLSIELPELNETFSHSWYGRNKNLCFVLFLHEILTVYGYTSFRTPIEQQLIYLTVLWKDKENCTYLPNEPKQMS